MLSQKVENQGVEMVKNWLTVELAAGFLVTLAQFL
jgi:hypothetical protein